MTPSRASGTHSLITGLGFLTTGLMAIAMLAQTSLAVAADSKGGITVLSVVRDDPADRPATTEIAPGGTVVMRGTRPASNTTANPNPGQPNPAGNTQAGGPATGSVYSGPGWDHRFDYSGLDWAGPFPVIGVSR